MKFVDSLTFITDKGNRSPKWGGNGGVYNLLTIPEGYRIVGIYGRSAIYLDKIGFIVGKNVYSNDKEE